VLCEVAGELEFVERQKIVHFDVQLQSKQGKFVCAGPGWKFKGELDKGELRFSFRMSKGEGEGRPPKVAKGTAEVTGTAFNGTWKGKAGKGTLIAEREYGDDSAKPDAAPPDDLVCPITGELMQDPVMFETGIPTNGRRWSAGFSSSDATPLP
jgi:hypothetical protein